MPPLEGASFYGLDLQLLVWLHITWTFLKGSVWWVLKDLLLVLGGAALWFQLITSRRIRMVEFSLKVSFLSSRSAPLMSAVRQIFDRLLLSDTKWTSWEPQVVDGRSSDVRVKGFNPPPSCKSSEMRLESGWTSAAVFTGLKPTFDPEQQKPQWRSTPASRTFRSRRPRTLQISTVLLFIERYLSELMLKRCETTSSCQEHSYVPIISHHASGE